MHIYLQEQSQHLQIHNVSMQSVDVRLEEIPIILLYILAYVRVIHQYIVIREVLST